MQFDHTKKAKVTGVPCSRFDRISKFSSREKTTIPVLMMSVKGIVCSFSLYFKLNSV